MLAIGASLLVGVCIVLCQEAVPDIAHYLRL